MSEHRGFDESPDIGRFMRNQDELYSRKNAAAPSPAISEPTTSDDDEPLCMEEVAAIAYQCLGAAMAPVRVMDYFSAVANGDKEIPPNPLPVLDTDFKAWQKVPTDVAPAIEEGEA